MIRGTFLGLEIARKGLLAARTGLDTTGHNISNANTEGYSRQRVVQRAGLPLAMPGPYVTMRPGQVGTGSEVISITRIRSTFIEAQMHEETGGLKHFETMSSVFTRVEDILGEPGDGGIGNLMESYFNAWEDLSNDPESASTRTNLRETAIAMTDAVQGIALKLDEEVSAINEQIRERIGRINSLASQIAEVNSQIMQIEAGGGGDSLKANDLKDRRDTMIEEISGMLNARVMENSDGSVSVLVDGHPLVGGQYSKEIGMRANPQDPQRPILEFSESRMPLPLHSGELAGLVEMRDVHIPESRDGLAKLISAFTNKVNKLHMQGYGLDGLKGRVFFGDTETRVAYGTLALPSGTTLDSTLDTLGISSGDFFVQGQRIAVADAEVLPGSAITLRTLLERMEAASSDVRAQLDTSLGYARIRVSQYNPVSAETPLSLKDGTSNFFEKSGLAKAPVQTLHLDPPYTNALANFRVSPVLMGNLNAIAAAGDDGLGFPGPGDNRSALAIGDLKNEVAAIDGSSFGEYFQGLIATLGSSASNVHRSVQSRALVVEQIEMRRQEVSGVNLDEEAVQLIRYQKAFEAAARAMTTIDETLSLIVSGLGAR